MANSTVLASEALVEPGYRCSKKESKARDKRKATTATRVSGAKNKDTSETGSSSAENEKGNRGSWGKKYRENTPSRKDAARARRGDTDLRRKAEELGISWPGHSCPSSPTHAHYYVEIVKDIFRCKHCWTVVWQPSTLYEAIQFGEKARALGVNIAYLYFIESKPRVINALVMFNALRLVRHNMDTDSLRESVDNAISRFGIVTPTQAVTIKPIKSL